MEQLKNKIFLNSGRNCLKYLVKSYKIREINIPYYICPIIWQTLKSENVNIKFYHIDKNFLPTKKFMQKDFILYPNYFGLCGKQSEYLDAEYDNIIFDNAHAFFAPPRGFASIYSPRKVLDVNDGGILISNLLLKEDFPTDENRNYEKGDYDAFCKNELSIDNQPIKLMSPLTKNFIYTENLEKIRENKRIIFNKIHQKMSKYNNFKFSISNDDIPMIYPLYAKENSKIAKLFFDNGIYIIKYWSKLPDYYTEAFFQNELLYIPINENSLEIINNMKISETYFHYIL